MTDVKIHGNRVVLEDYRIKGIHLIPEWEIVSTEETMPMLDEMGKPLLNDNGELIIFSKFTKVSRVLLKPQEVNYNAFKKPAAEEMDARKQTRNGKTVGKGNKEKEITQESKKE